MATMDQAKYEEIFGGTPMTRAKRSGLRRNAIIAATVRRDTRVTDLLGTLSEDEDPTIKATAKAAIDFLTK
jgi:epoxyqueuosine reductase